jgi:phage-related protein
MMVGHAKKLTARFYQMASGRSPVREWILDLSEQDRRQIGKDIQKVEFGWPISMPYCRSLGSGMWEIRSNLNDNRIGRVIFCIISNDDRLAAWLRQEDPENTTAGN